MPDSNLRLCNLESHFFPSTLWSLEALITLVTKKQLHMAINSWCYAVKTQPNKNLFKISTKCSIEPPSCLNLYPVD